MRLAVQPGCFIPFLVLPDGVGDGVGHGLCMERWADLDDVQEQGGAARRAGAARASNPFDVFTGRRLPNRREGEEGFWEWRQALAWWRGWDDAERRLDVVPPASPLRDATENKA